MKATMKYMLLAVATLFLPPTLHAEDWIDVTDMYITNPRFEGNDLYTGWQGTAFGSAGPMENAEHYSRNFDSYQELHGLKPGKYRLSVSAFYRYGDAQNDCDSYQVDPSANSNVYLYAVSSGAEYEEPVVHASSAALEESLGGSASAVWPEGGWWVGGPQLYIPNNMEASYYWFEAGYYKNTVEDVIVGEDGELRIGIRKMETVSGDWVCLDNWKLEYWGDKVNVTGLQLEQKTLALQFGESYRLVASVQPANATIQALRWESTDEEVATVDQEGMVKACNEGECEIIVTSRDNEDAYAVCQVSVKRDAIAGGSLIINEIMSKNVDMFLDPSFNFGGWIELYNPTDKAIGIGGCYVSDDPEDLMKYHMPDDLGSVPAHGYKNIWFDHNSRYGKAYQNVNMKLDCDGGTICVSDHEGRLIASQVFPEGIGRASWARTTDGGSEWGWTATPSPEATNAGSTFCTEQLAAPEVDTDGCMFEDGETFTVTVKIPAGSVLRYTTDGTTPTLESESSVTRRFKVSDTKVYRWRVFRDGMLPSPVVTRSYIKRNRNYTLPIVSVVTDPQNITGREYGVDVAGSGNGRSGNGTSSKVNYNMDWDRPVSFEYIDRDPQGNVDGYFQQEADFSICGGWSRKQTPRSFKIKATKTYDLNSLDYRFFEDRPYNRNKTVLLRNGGNDGHAQERIKDAAIHQMVKRSGLYCDLQDWNPTHVFINGVYRGMQNMRQPSNKHLGYSLYGIDTDEIDAFEMSVDSGYVQMAGTRDKFDEWYNLAKNAANEENWKQLCDLVDMDEYCNYMAVQFNLQNWDWPHNNLKGYRERREGAKFHMVLFDIDNVFEQNIGNPFSKFEERKTYTFYPIFEWNNRQLTKEVEHVTIFLNMLQNDTFRKKFIDTYCLVNGSVFEPKRCAEIVDEMAAILKPAMTLEGYGNNVTNRANTLKNNFNASRQNTAINYLRQYSRMKLSGTPVQQVDLKSNIEEGKILVNGMYVPTGKFHGGLFSPITLKAEAPAGYRFLGWKSAGSITNTTSLIARGQTWNYYNNGSLDNVDWKTGEGSVNWKSGQAPFGYGNSGRYMDTNSKTKVGGSNDKKLCVYFSKTITLDEAPAEGDIIRFNYTVDDGFRLHVNGEDVGGFHSLKGDRYQDYTESHDGNWYAGDTPAEGTIEIPARYFKKGENVIALDLHNCNSTSSDMFFDASLELVSTVEKDADYVSTNAEYTLPASGDIDLQAVFGEETDEEVLLASGNVPVKVNEVSAGNNVNVNDYFKKDDWIELYNNTAEDVDIAGMYLSDKAKTPLKFQVPADLEGLNTIIPAHGHLVVWASKRDIIGSDIHTNFKLDNEDGAMVILTAADQTWSDTLRYDYHDGQESFGRYPDGGRNVYHMTLPTIAAQNQLSLYSEFAYTYLYTGVPEKQPDEDAIMQTLAGEVQSVEYINANGIVMGGSREGLRPGIYVVRYRLSDGSTVTRKQVIR